MPLSKPIKPKTTPAPRVVCDHPVLKFGRMGGLIECSECGRRWHTVLGNTTLPDLIYAHPTLGDLDIRRK